MCYDNGCIGLLIIMKNVCFFFFFYMIYVYVFLFSLYGDDVNLELSKICIQFIYVMVKCCGIMGYLVSYFFLFCIKLVYYFLCYEDGLIYDNI